jgi:hypothetical protein
MTTLALHTTPEVVESMAAQTLRGVLQEWLIDRVPSDDGSRVHHVIVGKPTRELRDEMVVSVHMDHPFGPKMDKSTNISGLGGGLSGRPYVFPGETTGGMKIEEIIGCVQVRVRQRLAAEDASKLMYPILARIRQALNRDERLRFIEDGFGNYMFRIETFRATGYESGGGDVTINSKWVDFRALVCYSNCRDL